MSIRRACTTCVEPTVLSATQVSPTTVVGTCVTPLVLEECVFCGFDEFVPSNPPKKYAKRVTTGVMYTGTFVTNTCDTGLPTFTKSISLDTGIIAGSVTFTVTGSVFLPTDYHTGNNINQYSVLTLENITVPGPALWTVNGDLAPGTVTGNTTPQGGSLVSGDQYKVVVTIYQNFTNVFIAKNEFFFPLLPVRDVFDKTETYDLCDLTTVDNSARYLGATAVFPLTSGGTLASQPALTDYDSSLLSVSDTTLVRTITGLANCLLISGQRTKIQGTVTQTLSEEVDTT